MLATITQHPITAVMTHCHFDHMGGAHEFERRLGHKACNEMCHQPMSSEMNVSAFIRAETFRALPYEGFSVNQFSVKPAPLTGYLDEGDVIDLENRTFQIFHLPGHSPDSIALYEKKTEYYLVAMRFMTAIYTIRCFTQTVRNIAKVSNA